MSVVELTDEQLISLMRQLPADRKRTALLALAEDAGVSANLHPREALRQLQAQSRLTPKQAADYLQEVRAERLAFENGNGR